MSPASGSTPAAWRPTPGSDDGGTAPILSNVLLLIANPGNHQKVAQQLGTRLNVLTPNDDDLPPEGFDLAIADGPGLRRWRKALAEAKSVEQPVFLPVMLILPRAEIRGRMRGLSGIVDEFITSPIDRDEFLERISILLRARRQALAQRDELIRLVNYDRSTGLPNRHMFNDRVQSSMHSAEARSLRFYVLAVDIPLTKVQETVGESAAEEAAGTCSGRLCDAFERDVGLARLSMEKWAARMLTGTTMQEVLHVCTKIDELVSQRIDGGGESLRVNPRIGVARYPGDAATASDLIDAAIAASNRAKPGEPAFYCADQRNAALHYIRTEASLHEALQDDQFELWLQPKLDLQRQQIRSAEALIRWRLPSGQLVPPSAFIPVAETSGFIRYLTGWVLATAVRVIAEWNAMRDHELRIAVNITPVDVQQPEFPGWLQGLCAQHGVRPDLLEVELTETMLCDMDASTLDQLRRLRDAGFPVAIDDFGTGYSSLGYLHLLPADTIKIDKRFIDDVPSASSGVVVTHAIMDLGNAFGLELVAEGIENQAQLDYLRDAGVHYGQGFHIARPMPSNDFKHWLGHNN